MARRLGITGAGCHRVRFRLVSAYRGRHYYQEG